MADAIIRTKKRSVSVRIVVDSTMVETKGSQIPRLRQYNILTCSISCPGDLIHNTFAVIGAFESNSVSYIKSAKSSRGTAMSGSFNWTWTGVLYNEENVYISSDADFVNPLAYRFEKICNKVPLLFTPQHASSISRHQGKPIQLITINTHADKHKISNLT